MLWAAAMNAHASCCQITGHLEVNIVEVLGCFILTFAKSITTQREIREFSCVEKLVLDNQLICIDLHHQKHNAGFKRMVTEVTCPELHARLNNHESGHQLSLHEGHNFSLHLDHSVVEAANFHTVTHAEFFPDEWATAKDPAATIATALAQATTAGPVTNHACNLTGL